MSDTDEGATVATSVRSARVMTISVGEATYTAEPSDSPITIGREFPAQIRVPDQRISRTHARLQIEGEHWIAVDQSSNGTYLDGNRQESVVITDGMTLQLGNPEGIPVRFRLAVPAQTGEHVPLGPADDDDQFEDDESGDDTEESDVTSPDIARAGAAVSARRRELNIAQRTLAKDKIMNAGALISFEKGRSWPRRATLTKLEQVLKWEPGTIARIRWGADGEPGDFGDPSEHTVVLTNTVQAPLMVEAVEVALSTIRTQIKTLPMQSDPEFTGSAAPILADLRKLEHVAVNAARSAKGAADVAMVLSAVRRIYRELMLRAARAPHATFGQQLFAARHSAELSTEEAANAAGVPIDAINAAEADHPVGNEALAAIQGLLASLSHH